MPEAIRRITKRFMKDPQEVRIQSSITTRPDISQSYWTAYGRKSDALVRFLEAEDFDAAIIFVRTKMPRWKSQKRWSVTATTAPR